ncbi:hypothetical protein KC887_01295 [Candidatus Kaiserbacteria bacterium]|nr:hypothetical protein [Candidatus Kaiserbacteria bacterium]
MADLPEIDETIDPQLQAYYDQLVALTAAALAGTVDEQGFVERMERIVLAALLLAYLLGGGTAATAEDDEKYQERIEQNRNSVEVLAADIYSGRYSKSDKQTADEAASKLDSRLSLWVIGLAAVYDLGKNQQPDTIIVNGEVVEYTETWRVGPTEHCNTCLALDGVSLTPSEWVALGLEPRSPDLDCGGWNCLCSRQPEGRPSDGLANVARLLGV